MAVAPRARTVPAERATRSARVTRRGAAPALEETEQAVGPGSIPAEATTPMINSLAGRTHGKPSGAKVSAHNDHDDGVDAAVPLPDDTETKNDAPPIPPAEMTPSQKRASQKQPEQPPQRQRMPRVVEGGWMTALPRGDQQRRAYRRSNEEIQDATGRDVLYESVTKKVKGLLGNVAAAAIPSTASSASGIPFGGANFSAFRKNCVPRAPAATVRLRYASTKSHNSSRVDMDRQQEEMEAQRRRADELFGDGPAVGAARSRRRG